MTNSDPDKIAGYVIDALRERDDITHVSRFNFDNKRIEVIVEPDDLDDQDIIIPSEALHLLSGEGFKPVSARFSTDGKFSPEARVMGFERD